jgi:hypothetical protein
MLPIRNSLRELPRTAEVFGRFAERAALFALLVRANYEDRSATEEPRIAAMAGRLRMSRMGHSSFVIHSAFDHSAFGIFQTISPRQFPQATAIAAARNTNTTRLGSPREMASPPNKN